MQEIHITCKLTSLLPDTVPFSLAPSKPARYFSDPLSEGSVCSERPTAGFRGAGGRAYLSAYGPGINGLVLPAGVFASLQAQGQSWGMSGVSELLLFMHTLPR